ncbi:hypothetical protein ABPG74_012799 [Tetrahymena malaccensis]
MIFHRFSLNFKNKRYEQEYQCQNEKYQKNINRLNCVVFMIFSLCINLEVYIYTNETITIITAIFPILLAMAALYKNTIKLNQVKVFMFLAIICHVVLSASIQYQKFRNKIQSDQNFVFGSLTGIIIGIVASGMQQWYLKEFIILIYIMITFFSAISQFTFEQIALFIPIIVIEIILSNIISYYREMQSKMQFYDQLVAKDTIFDLKNLLQNNIPQSIFVVSQKPKKQHQPSTVNCNNKQGNEAVNSSCNNNNNNNNNYNNNNNNENNHNNLDLENNDHSRVSIDCEDELVINFQNKYFTDYQKKFNFSYDVTSFLKMIKIQSQSQIQVAQPSAIKVLENSNIPKSINTPYFGTSGQQSILDIIVQQIKDTANDKVSQNDPLIRQRRQTIAQDKGFQLDNIKEYFNCQYKQDPSAFIKPIEPYKEKRQSKKKKKNCMMSEFRQFGRALSQISFKNASANNTPRGTIGNGINELQQQNANNLNISNIYNATKKRQSSKSPTPQENAGAANQVNQKNEKIRRKCKTVSLNNDNYKNSKQRQMQQLQIKTKIVNLNSQLLKQNQNPSTQGLTINTKQNNSGLVDKNQLQVQNPLQNISIYPNQTSEIQSLSYQEQLSNLPSAQVKQTNKLNQHHQTKQDADSFCNKQSRQSITSQNLQSNIKHSAIHKSIQANSHDAQRRSTQQPSQTNGGYQMSSINNLSNKYTNKSENNLKSKQYPILYFDIQLVKCQWEENDAVMVIMNDISEKVMNLRLKEGDKYKDEMLATVTHNLKTPLNSMILLINKLLKKEKKNKELKIISQSSNMLLSMIMDILDYQCIKRKTFKLQIEAFDILDVINEIKQLFQISADIKGLEINIVNNIKNPDMQLVLQDMDRIKQILNNLVGNAIKFTKKGSVTIIIGYDTTYSSEQTKQEQNTQNQLKDEQGSPKLQINNNSAQNDEKDAEKSVKLNNYQRIFQNNGVISIQVKDTGSGIDQSLQQNLFKIFATHDHNNGSTKHGVGLGLTVCRKLVKLIGPKRSLLLDSTPGHGSSFTFFIYQNLLTSPKQYTSELKNQISPIIISSSQENNSINLQNQFSQNQNMSQASESETHQQVPIFQKSLIHAKHQQTPPHSSAAEEGADTKNIIISSPKGSEKSPKRINQIDSPLYKTDNIDTGVTPRNQQSIQFRSSDASLNHLIKDEKQQQSKFGKNDQKPNRKKSNKLFQGSQISLILDLNSPLQEQKQFEKNYLSSFLNFTPRSNANYHQQNTVSTINNINQKLLSKRDSDNCHEGSSLRLIVGNNLLGSPKTTSTNIVFSAQKDKDFFSKQQARLKNRLVQQEDFDDTLIKSGEINDYVLSESYNKSPDKILNYNLDFSPKGHRPFIQTPKKSLFNLDSKHLIYLKTNNQISMNNIHMIPQSSTSISIDRHFSHYPSNNLLATFHDYNKYEEKFQDNLEDEDFNFKPMKYLESQTNIGIEQNKIQQLPVKQSSSNKSDSEYQNSLQKQLYMSESPGVFPSLDKQIIEKDGESYSDNIQDDSQNLSSSSSNYTGEDGQSSNGEDEQNLGDVEEEDDESKEEEEDNMNLEGLFSNTINALIVDDTPFNIFVLKSFFQNCKNIKFSQAFDGKEAFELYKENKYDLVFMDLNMPIMDGFESIALIRQYEHQNNLKESIIFAVTAQDQIKDIQKCIDCGANGHIPKPVKLSLLYSSLYQYFKRR